MSHERLEELVAGYALDALGEEARTAERDLVEHLAVCESCRRLFGDLRETAADLALAAPPSPVPPDLERRVLGAARGERGDPARVARPRWASRVGAAAAVVAIASLGAWSAQLAGDVREARRDSAATRAALALVADPTAARATLAGTEGRATVAVVGARGVLIAGALPRLAEGRVFELWLVRDGVPVPAAVFGPDRGVVSFRVEPGAYDAAAITVEPGPRGSRRPTGAQILGGRMA